MTTNQVIQALTSPLALLIATAILAIVVQPWLRAHHKAIDATTASIQDATLRGLAQDAVRWLETDPAMAQLPGLVQRSRGITFLAQRTGLPVETVTTALDAAYNALTATGKVVIAPKTPPPAAPASPTLSDLAAAVLAQIRPIAPSEVPVVTPPPTTQPSPAVATAVAPLAPTEPAT